MKFIAHLSIVLIFLFGTLACQEKKKDDKEVLRDILTSRTLGLAYLEENKLEDAEREFLNLIELAPDEALGFANLGLVYLRMAKYEEAEKYLLEAVEVEEKDPGIRLLLAKVYEFTDREDKVIEVLDENIRIDPDNLKTLYALSEYYAKSKTDEAVKEREEYLNRIVVKSPGNLVPRLQLIEVLINEDRPDEALSQLEEIPRIYADFPPEAKPFYDDAVTLLRESKTSEAQTPVRIFHNFFKVSSIYQSGIQELKGPGGELVGIPLITMGSSMNTYIQEGESVLESIKFTDVTVTVGLDVSGTVSGNALQAADFDNDGDQDLYFGGGNEGQSGKSFFLFKNDMGSFSDIAVEGGLAHGGLDSDVIFADYDNDGKLDIYVVSNENNKLYKNQGEGLFDDVSKNSLIDLMDNANTCLFFDYDHEGDLDLLLLGSGTDKIFQNKGDGTFSDVSQRAGFLTANTNSQDAVFGDFDDDGDIDLIIVNANGNIIYDNLRQGKYRDITEESGLGKSMPGKTIDVGDYNNDGYLDFVIGGYEKGAFQLYKNGGDGTFTIDQQEIIADNTLKSIEASDLKFFDFDNDGTQDILIAGKGEHRGLMLLHNDGWGQFEDESKLLPDTHKSVQRAVITDFNEDGDLDIFFSSAEGGVHLLRNDGGNANRYLKVQLVGIRSGSGKNNHFGIGAKVEVRAGSLYQMKVVTDPMVHFGLSNKEQADVVRILWTNGVPQNIFTPRSDQDLIEEQELKGSCPFLYAWNGEKFVFVKDMMWRSALGMPLGIMGGNTAYAFADISKEYLKVNGDLLHPKDGKYTIQITEELWETVYFDKLKLMAVDHPAEEDFFLDEKFTLPPFPGLNIYGVNNKLTPSSVVDESGNSLLPYILNEDDFYISNFEKTPYQGLIKERILTLNLDKIGNPDNIHLFLNGWIFPTDASINVNISQSDKYNSIAPYLQVRDKEGNWIKVMDIGFPMGKDKTMVVDLSGKFLSDDHHVRIITNMEIYWDHIFYAEVLEETHNRITPLNMVDADFHYRGYSKMYRKDSRYGPHWFDYYNIERGQKWRDLTGAYTRYGDVSELLGEGDDQYIIANAGDEVTISFDAENLPVIPKGWKRDFIIYSEGWVKDGDLNTAYGQTVDPLPFRNMRQYPYNNNQSYPYSGANKAYHEKYNTRVINTNTFRRSLADRP